ncbi:magnesium/cobalt transporter CorA [Mucilaginibacter xinganensis]|uniref:Magnesium transport protein CorA n=1 Tax=Mucilaginibacter xinganensis TaxID=1234841 RepID=A0A223NT49_9SPHI|nr:magnesium/cobalt transporter CorA [Mucilaginibacter xinganensis]ASU33079.1 magnesium and cobalt transport protein CorA [Mucilaginibacter xinganensis]
MNHSIKRIRYNPRRKAGNIGDSPGAIIIPEDAVKPLICVFSYNAKELVTNEGKSIKVVLDQFKKCPDHTHWVQIRGLGDAGLIEDIGAILTINPLVLEDITNIHQRPKFDEYDDYLFAVSRMINFTKDYELVNNQFSALVKDNVIITFEETHEEYFEAVKNRLASGKGAIRTAGAGYMCYALTDTILDRYFALLAKLGDQLDTVEDRLYGNVDKSIMFETQQLKRTLIVLRRSCWPERDKINDMLRTENSLINPEVKLFLKDAYDHCIQIMDLIESYKEITSSIMDIYLSMVSNRMNEIMKVLTIISVIFIPLTFIAGVYGMNFSRVDPVTNKVMPDNLPELYNPHGYFYALGGMFVIGIIQVIIFWRKGWFSKL